ncbi:MAG: nucleoside triphosphate pyrophosphohydrolase [Lonepinella koalarum]|nr:nucleoside triphosphate pyrophosphohydrolase [Lonepinella koalarum]
MSEAIQHLLAIVAKLRDPNGGCPWDLKQTFQTMIPHLLEESYEVVEAIEKQNIDNLREELGDLLLQTVFLSQLAKEDNLFTFDDVVTELAEKLVRRHPHVFAGKSANNEQEALQNWNAMKAAENQQKGHVSILDNIPQAFPALLRAEKIQKKCSKVGFDWDNVQSVLAKVEEEIAEVKQELNRPHFSFEKTEEELGDLLFATVNLTRHLGVQAEESLRKANLKFERRFRAVEQKLASLGRTLEQSSLAEMDELWNAVKAEEQEN